MKFAELQNFNAAQEIFDGGKDESIIQMQNYSISEFQHLPRLNYNLNHYIALRFLDQLITQWDQRRKRDDLPWGEDLGTTEKPGLEYDR